MDRITAIRAADRRGAPRVSHPFGGSCSGQSGHRDVRITDLSITGCFIESLEPMAAGEQVAVRIDVPDWGALDLSGIVVYVAPPMGFAVRFIDVTESARRILQALVEAELRTRPVP